MVLMAWNDAAQGRDTLVALLLGAGANPNIEDEEGCTPLHWSAEPPANKAPDWLPKGATVEKVIILQLCGLVHVCLPGLLAILACVRPPPCTV